MRLSKKEIEILDAYESNFITAIRSKYTRNIPSRELDILVNIYKRVTPNSDNFNLCKTCSTAVLSFIQKLGEKKLDFYGNFLTQKKLLNTHQSQLETTITNLVKNTNSSQMIFI